MRGYEAQLAVSRAPAVTRTEASAGFGRSLSWARAATAGETAGGPSLAVHALGDTVCQTSPTAHVLARMQGRAFSRQQPPRASIDETGRGHALTLLERRMYGHLILYCCIAHRSVVSFGTRDVVCAV